MSAPADWLRARAEETPEREALVAGSERWSFAALHDEVRVRARRLREDRASGATIVAARLSPDAEGVLDFWSVLYAGVRLFSLNSRLSSAEQVAQLARVRPTLALGALRYDGERPADGAPTAEAGLVLFTSGTSGPPKPALLEARHLEASARASARHLGTREDDRWLLCLPLFHVGGLMILVRSVLDGAGVVLHPGFEVGAVERDLHAERISLASLVPTTLKRLLDGRREPAAPPCLRAVLLGGAAAPEGLVRRARAAGFPVRPTYGLTEAASQVATAEPGDEGPGLVGRPLPGNQIRIVDAAGRVLPAGTLGTIEVRGPSVFAGYLGDPAKTAAVLRGGWLHTGDRGQLDAQGRLFVRERIGDLVVSGGENVHPSEVESALLDHPAVDEVAVAGLPDPDLGQRVAAWLVLRRDRASPDARELRAFLRDRLAGYKQPRVFHFVTALPRNAMGKVVRRQLAELGAERAADPPEPGDMPSPGLS